MAKVLESGGDSRVDLTVKIRPALIRPMTSARDFGTGAKWHRIYAVASTCLLFSFSPIIFLCILMGHTGTTKTRTGRHTWVSCLQCEFFSFLFPILLPPRSAVHPTLQWDSTPPRHHDGQRPHFTHVSQPRCGHNVIGLHDSLLFS